MFLLNNICLIGLIYILLRNYLSIKDNGSISYKNFDEYIFYNFDSKKLILIGLILFSFRLISFGVYPNGINQDEASMAYDVYSLIHYGVDRNGDVNPVYFEAWGSGQNALYAYILMPFVAIFGLNTFVVRLPMLIISTICIIYFYKLGKLIFNKDLSILSLFLLLISPWFFKISRWGLESNIYPMFLLVAIYYLVKSFEDNKLFIISSILFGLSLYGYAISYITVPIFLLIMYIWMFKNKKINVKTFIMGNIILFTIALPLILELMININLLPEIKTSFISLPKFSESRMDEVSFSLIDILLNILRSVLMLINQYDYSNIVSTKLTGYIYPFSAIFIIIGLVVVFKRNFFVKYLNEIMNEKSFVIKAWLIASFVTIFFVENNQFTKMNSILLPIIYITAIGLYFSIRYIKLNSKFILSIYLMFFMLFNFEYYVTTKDEINFAYNSSLSSAIEFANTIEEDNIYITEKINMPYIHVLYTLKTPVYDFIDTVEYDLSNLQFKKVKSFDKYYFNIPNKKDLESTYIIYNHDIEQMEQFRQLNFDIKTFENFSVAYKKTDK